MKLYNGEEFSTLTTTHGGSYESCQWCHGEGCIACVGEAKKDAEKATEPLFVADRNNPDDMRLLKEYFGLHALQHAFGPEGTGMHEIEYNACIANLFQLMRKESFDRCASAGVKAEGRCSGIELP